MVATVFHLVVAAGAVAAAAIVVVIIVVVVIVGVVYGAVVVVAAAAVATIVSGWKIHPGQGLTSDYLDGNDPNKEPSLKDATLGACYG